MSKFDGLLSVKTKHDPNKAVKAAPEPGSTQNNGKSKSPGKRSDPSYTQITAYIKKDTHESVMRKIYKRKEFSELIEELLTDWMKKTK